MKKLSLFSLFVALAIFMVSCGQPTAEEQTSGETSTSTPEKGQSNVNLAGSDGNILAIAINSPDHTTLVAAVQAAELEDVLANNGPLTVFAPTNAAFEKLPPGTVEELLKPENKNKLAKIIKFHAAPGTYRVGSTLKDGQQLYMATGHYVPVVVSETEVIVNGSPILGSVDATNGVVHVVDFVWLPPEMQ